MEIHALDLKFLGFPEAIASYLVVGPEGPVLVETGPASTLAACEQALAAHGFGRKDVRHVFVTHIHLDHAGAAGWWAERGAQLYVHEFGAKHLIDPSKLLAGKSIVGSLMYRPELLPTLLNFLVRNQSKLPFHKIVSHKFPLAEVNEAFPQAEWNSRQTDITRAMLVP